MADEFFRASYSQGIWAQGTLAKGLKYKVNLMNNLSNLGVDASELDADPNTISAALWWMPTTGEYGVREEFGDYSYHEDLATRIGIAFTYSREDDQSQPGLDDPENSQIRLSDGTLIFNPGALAPGVQLNKATYQMASAHTGFKYRGFSWFGEYYVRQVDELRADGPIPFDDFFDQGFQMQTSAMVLPKTLQVYAFGSKVFGEFGNPWELGTGINWYPFNRRELRWNNEYFYTDESPAGNTSIPLVSGGTGSVFVSNLELFF